jgi:hypothetical protein
MTGDAPATAAMMFIWRLRNLPLTVGDLSAGFKS